MASMKPVCCDTSFLVSFYGKDSLSERSSQAMVNLASHLTLSHLNCYELEQSIHFMVWRGKLSYARAQMMKSAFDADCNGGLMQVVSCNFLNVITKARRLSAVYTETSGYRSMDTLIVANALELGADRFLSFDQAQCKLAKAEGLKLNS